MDSAPPASNSITGGDMLKTFIIAFIVAFAAFRILKHIRNSKDGK